MPAAPTDMAEGGPNYSTEIDGKAMNVWDLPMNLHYKNFNMEEEEILVDRKVIKCIDMMPADIQPRFKALYVNDNERAVIGDKLDCEIEALEASILARK